MKFPLSKCCAVCELEEEYRRLPWPPSTDPEFIAKAAAKRAAWEEKYRAYREVHPIQEKLDGDETPTGFV